MVMKAHQLVGRVALDGVEPAKDDRPSHLVLHRCNMCALGVVVLCSACHSGHNTGRRELHHSPFHPCWASIWPLKKAIIPKNATSTHSQR